MRRQVSDHSDLLTIIPARGGSKRLKHKNILPARNGLPLFVATASFLQYQGFDPVVASDDPTILSMARARGFRTFQRSEVSDDQTVVQASAEIAEALGHTGPVLTVQPTVTPLPRFDGHGLTSCTVPSILAAKAPHIYWHEADAAEFDVTRHLDGIWQELGAYYWPAGTVGTPPVEPLLLASRYYDIDTPDDYLAATRRRFSFSVTSADPEPWTGTGHRRRAETLRIALQHHEDMSDMGHVGSEADVLIYDTGNTYLDWGIFADQAVVTFEDRGPGTRRADLVINALLPPTGAANERTGPKWAIIRSEFMGLMHPSARGETETSGRVLVVFGGTDAKSLTANVASQLSEAGLTPVTPDAKYHLAELMTTCDLLISGAGQTVHEAAYVGIPTIVAAATQREASHAHLGSEYGNIFMGLATTVRAEDFIVTVHRVLNDADLRMEMSARGRAAVDGRGLERVVWEIERLGRGL